MRVECKVEECDVDPEDGRESCVPGVCVTCSRCNEEAVAFGTEEKSIKKALATLREDCPNGESNFYVAEETGGESRMPDPVVRPWWEK
jgi:riboflavin synthase alpha subunit